MSCFIFVNCVIEANRHFVHVLLRRDDFGDLGFRVNPDMSSFILVNCVIQANRHCVDVLMRRDDFWGPRVQG